MSMFQDLEIGRMYLLLKYCISSKKGVAAGRRSSRINRTTDVLVNPSALLILIIHLMGAGWKAKRRRYRRGGGG